MAHDYLDTLRTLPRWAILFFLLFGLGLLRGSVCSGWHVHSTFHEAQQMQSWEAVDATLMSARLADVDGPASLQEYYVEYKYQFDGQLRVGNRVTIDDPLVYHQRDIIIQMSTAAAHGEKITIWVNPDAPDESIIDRNILWPNVIIELLAMVICGCIGLALVMMGIVLSGVLEEKNTTLPHYQDTPRKRRKRTDYGALDSIKIPLSDDVVKGKLEKWSGGSWSNDVSPLLHRYTSVIHKLNIDITSMPILLSRIGGESRVQTVYAILREKIGVFKHTCRTTTSVILKPDMNITSMPILLSRVGGESRVQTVYEILRKNIGVFEDWRPKKRAGTRRTIFATAKRSHYYIPTRATIGRTATKTRKVPSWQQERPIVATGKTYHGI